MAGKGDESKRQESFEELERKANESGTNVVLGAKPDVPIIDNQATGVGATGTGIGRGNSEQETEDDVGGPLEGGVTNFFKQ